LAEALTLGLERVLRASQRLTLMLKLRNGGSSPVGLLRNLDRLAPQVVEVRNELIVTHDDLCRFAPKESIVDREFVVAPSSLDRVHPSIHAQLLAEHHGT
jgi:hypothetical protein